MIHRSLVRQTVFGLLGSAFVWCMPAMADDARPTEADLDRAFAAVIADPSNLDASFEYARIAAALGDFEGAVSSLERMLIFNPKLPRVHVELGVLYFRLRSFEAARSYFDQALAFPE
jgi:Flp pilus assembly protein TadD